MLGSKGEDRAKGAEEVTALLFQLAVPNHCEILKVGSVDFSNSAASAIRQFLISRRLFWAFAMVPTPSMKIPTGKFPINKELKRAGSAFLRR